MRNTLFLSLFLLPLISLGQQYVSSISMNFDFAATYFQSDYYGAYNTKPNAVWKPQLGLNFIVSPNNKNGFYSSVGLQYSSFSQNLQGLLYPSYSEYCFYVTSSTTAIHSIQIPVKVGYTFSKLKIKPYFGIGYSSAFLTSFHQKNEIWISKDILIEESIDSKGIEIYDRSNNTSEFNDNNEPNQLFNKVNYFALAEVGVSYGITTRSGG